MSLKKGDGAVTQHGTNKQFGKGPGASNTPLKKSSTNPTQPNIQSVKGHGGSAPKSPPQATAKQGNDTGRHTVLLTEKKAAGRDSTKSTFTAPRKGDSSDPLQAGFVRLGKAT